MSSPDQQVNHRRRPWRYAEHPQPRWVGHLLGMVSSLATHLWFGMILAGVTVTFFRFSIENAHGPQLLSAQAPYDRIQPFSPVYFLPGSGTDNVDTHARISGGGTQWDSRLPDPTTDAPVGAEEYVSSGEMGAVGAFSSVGPHDLDAGMFGSRRESIAQRRADIGCRYLERENSLRVALAWIARQQSPDGWWYADGKPSVRLTSLAVICLMDSTNGGEPRFIPQMLRALGSLATARSSGENQALLIWALLLERENFPSAGKERLRAAIAHLMDQQDPAGGWRSESQRPGLIDTRTTAWALLALRQVMVDHAEIDCAPAMERAAQWLGDVQRILPLGDQPSFPSVWDTKSGQLRWMGDELVLGAFTVLLVDRPQHLAWFEAMASRLIPLPSDGLLDDPQRLAVLTLIRMRLESEDLKSWLSRIERQLGRRQERHGAEAGSWSPPAGLDRLEFSLWNALLLHQAYAH